MRMRERVGVLHYVDPVAWQSPECGHSLTSFSAKAALLTIVRSPFVSRTFPHRWGGDRGRGLQAPLSRTRHRHGWPRRPWALRPPRCHQGISASIKHGALCCWR